MITVLFVDPNTKVVEKRVIENSLEGYYGLLGCSAVEGGFLGEDVWVYFDEEATFKAPQSKFVIGNVPIMGRAMFICIKGEEAVSISDAAIEVVKRNIEFL